VTVNVCPEISIVPVLDEEPVFAATLIEMLPFPLPEEDDESHELPEVTEADQEQPVPTETLLIAE
jgi:hypothetical protein